MNSPLMNKTDCSVGVISATRLTGLFLEIVLFSNNSISTDYLFLIPGDKLQAAWEIEDGVKLMEI